MRIYHLVFPAALALIVLGCSDEKNPYKGMYQSASTEGTSSEKAASSDGKAANSQSTSPSVVSEQATIDTKTVAKADSIPKASLSLIQTICANQPFLANVQAQMAILCINNQPTEALAKALAAPYKGGANPPLIVIKSLDTDGTSEFVFMSVIEVPKPVAEVFAKRTQLATGTVIGTNSMSTGSVVPVSPASGDSLGVLEITNNVEVQVGNITAESVRILLSDARALNADKSIIAIVNQLKPEVNDPRRVTLANAISFMVQDGTGTKIISVNHLQVNNRGRHPTAETTALTIGAATMTDVFTKITQ